MVLQPKIPFELTKIIEIQLKNRIEKMIKKLNKGKSLSSNELQLIMVLFLGRSFQKFESSFEGLREDIRELMKNQRELVDILNKLKEAIEKSTKES